LDQIELKEKKKKRKPSKRKLGREQKEWKEKDI